jgi:hypothetical protein
VKQVSVNYYEYNVVARKMYHIKSLVTYILPTCFDLYRAIIREVYTQTYKCKKICQKYACVELNNLIVNYSY